MECVQLKVVELACDPFDEILNALLKVSNTSRLVLIEVFLDLLGICLEVGHVLSFRELGFLIFEGVNNVVHCLSLVVSTSFVFAVFVLSSKSVSLSYKGR